MSVDKNLKKDNNVKVGNNTKTSLTIHNKKEQEWLEENKEAIEQQNERIKREGSFFDEHRRF